jgi:hypothetical protein
VQRSPLIAVGLSCQTRFASEQIPHRLGVTTPGVVVYRLCLERQLVC